ncbi:hypothetical protein SteCoe_23342 [Stentor coeruleus]|uniref:EF-hand domain-containing protein n=1 Tax=Stentor coeruleus TaxID=5963 RepID=A0A1R2BK34_9CILI|nr:hypothetical protein SteCoe_23342 [Stentor coeruleus]
MDNFTPEEIQQFNDINKALERGDLTRVNELFNLIDRNHNGTIESSEIKLMMEHMLGESASDEEVAGIILELDTNKNGVIDINEFIYLMKDKYGSN